MALREAIKQHSYGSIMSNSILSFLFPLSFPLWISVCSFPSSLASNWPTLPQVYLKGEFVGGCDIMMKYHQDNELEKMLVDAGAIQKSKTE
jgi:hypothetical protein